MTTSTSAPALFTRRRACRRAPSWSLLAVACCSCLNLASHITHALVHIAAPNLEWSSHAVGRAAMLLALLLLKNWCSSHITLQNGLAAQHTAHSPDRDVSRAEPWHHQYSTCNVRNTHSWHTLTVANNTGAERFCERADACGDRECRVQAELGGQPAAAAILGHCRARPWLPALRRQRHPLLLRGITLKEF